MEIECAVGECCGIHKFYNLPSKKQEFISQARNLISYEWGDDEENYPVGAMILASTIQRQDNEAAYLTDVGFKALMIERNTNTGNMVTLWGMNFNKFLAAIGF